MLADNNNVDDLVTTKMTINVLGGIARFPIITGHITEKGVFSLSEKAKD